MQHKYIIFFILAGTAFAYILVSTIVMLTGGKNSASVRSKLRLGGILITLTSLLACSSNDTNINPNVSSSSNPNIEPIVSCYEMPSEETETTAVMLFNSSKKQFEISLDNENSITITGKLIWGETTPLSYRFQNTDGEVLLAADLNALDGEIDSQEEQFEIHVSNVVPGNYQLNLYSSSIEDQDDVYIYDIFLINVVGN